MKIKNYIVSKIPYLIINLVIYFLLVALLKVASTPEIILFLIFMIWFVPLIVYMVLEYIKERIFYGEIISITEKLYKNICWLK